MNIRITNHAIDRYRERIGPLPADGMLSRMEMLSKLFSAKPKHIRRLQKRKRTVLVPRLDCLFVFEGWTMVTVLKRNPDQPAYVFGAKSWNET